MKKLQVLIIGILIVTVGLVYRHLDKIETETSKSSKVSDVTGRSVGESRAEPSVDPSVPSSQASQEYVTRVRKEAESISQLQADPDGVQDRLKELASQMREEDIGLLQEVALNTALSGDERFLSIHILGESSLFKAQQSLEMIAATPVPQQQEARLTNQEEILRVKAVESLREVESLKRVLAKADNSFILDRAQRNLLYREGVTSKSPEEQDQEALSLLLKKARR